MSLLIEISMLSAALEAIEAGNWQSNRNWKAVFGMEVGSEVGWKALDPTAPNVPVFELTCRLLYRENPANLVRYQTHTLLIPPFFLFKVPFVKFAQLARDYQAQGDSSFARKCRKVSSNSLLANVTLSYPYRHTSSRELYNVCRFLYPRKRLPHAGRLCWHTLLFCSTGRILAHLIGAMS